MKRCLAAACGFVSLCASLPTYAGDAPAPPSAGSASEPFSERVAAIVQPKSKHDAPAEGGDAAPKNAEPQPKNKGASKTAERNDAAPTNAEKRSDDAGNADKKSEAKPSAAPPAPRGKAKKGKGKRKQKQDAGSSAAGRKVSIDEDFLVEGKLEKPNAYYILRRSQSGYDWARLDAKFLPLVLESVQDPLF